jgi:hypothetical protein
MGVFVLGGGSCVHETPDRQSCSSFNKSLSADKLIVVAESELSSMGIDGPFASIVSESSGGDVDIMVWTLPKTPGGFKVVRMTLEGEVIQVFGGM